MDITIDIDDYKLNVRAAGVIIHNNILLVHRNINSDHYALVGGRVQIGEDSETTVKREIAIEKELRSKIEWACTFSNCEPKIKNGNLRMVEKTNIAYVEPHSAVTKNRLYLFFNEHDYFYVGNLANKYALSKLGDFISRN